MIGVWGNRPSQEVAPRTTRCDETRRDLAQRPRNTSQLFPSRQTEPLASLAVYTP